MNVRAETASCVDYPEHKIEKCQRYQLCTNKFVTGTKSVQIIFGLILRFAHSTTTMTLGMLSTDKHKSSTTAFRILFTMERLLSPCTRLHDTLEREGGLEDFRSHNPEDFQELNLDVSTEVLLSAERAFTHADLYAMLGNEDTIAWLTPHAFVARKGGSVVDYCYHLYNEEGTGLSHYGFSADDKYIVVMARSPSIY
jgi:hypothetical protein